MKIKADSLKIKRLLLEMQIVQETMLKTDTLRKKEINLFFIYKY